MSKHELKNFVIVMRDIAQAYRDHRLSRAERDVYLWMRINANPYGFYVVSLESISLDVFGSTKHKNYVNRLLLSLKSKRFIYYKQRSGRRGTFEVHFGDWLLPSKDSAGKSHIKTLDSFFDKMEGTTKRIVLTNPHSEDYTEVAAAFQKLKTPDTLEKIGDSSSRTNTDFRGSDTDNENDKDNETNRLRAYGTQSMSLEEFKPKSHEEEACHVFARHLQEKNMRFILGVLSKYGFRRIEQAYIKVKNEMAKGAVENPRKLFNYLINHPEHL